MSLTRDQALAALGLTATPDADGAAVQKAFERLARRYPQPSFPARFRELLEARDELLNPMRSWRALLQSRTLDLTWIVPRIEPPAPAIAPDSRSFLQSMLRDAYLADPLEMSVPEFMDEIDDEGDEPDDEP
jgi:hypothetical protein